MAPTTMVAASPDHINIVGYHGLCGWFGTKATRNLTLRTVSQGNGLQLVPQDIPDTKGLKVLPASAITAATPVPPLVAGGRVTLLVTFNLTDVPAGEYVGQLSVAYTGGEMMVPVTVKVAAPFPLPLLITILGVCLGTALSWYRAQRGPQDEFWKRLGGLRETMKTEPDLSTEFESYIETQFRIAVVDLGNSTVAKANADLDLAYSAFNKWQKYRPHWIAEFDYADQLAGRMDEVQDAAEFRYLQDLRRDLRQARDSAPELETVQALASLLEAVPPKLTAFLELNEALKLLRSAIESFGGTDGEKTKAEDERLDLLEKAKNISASDEKGLADLKAEVTTALSQIRSAGNSSMAVAKSGNRPIPDLPVRSHAGPLPDEAATIVEANRGAQIFLACSYVLAVGLLGAGVFRELYTLRLTFGSDGWVDYFALFAAGFGAEATRDSLVNTIQGWSLPGAGGKPKT